jgi:hypothetical protein
MNRLASRIWESPTAMTWASQVARTGTLLFVLPLVLNRFTAEEVAVYYLFWGVISLSALADFGFRGTFTRLVAYSAGGATDIGVKRSVARNKGAAINWELLEKLGTVMNHVYWRTTVLVGLALAVVGTLAMWRPVMHLQNPTEAWIAWSVLCATTTLEYRGKMYRNYLEGLFFVALVKRVETFFRAGSMLSSLAVMTVAPGLLNLMLVNSFWVTANFFRDRFLARSVHEGRIRTFRPVPYEREFLMQVWSPAWRTGISSLMSKGFLGVTGILYAQIGAPVAVASYLLAIRLVSAVRDVCNSPFNSKIPLLGRLRASGDVAKFIREAQRGISLSNVTYLVGVLAIGLLSESLLRMIRSQTPFVPLDLWWLISIGFFGHRIGHFFINLYQTTNHVVSHMVDGIAGIIFAVVASILIRPLDLYAFPLGMIVAYGGFHSAVSIRYTSLSLPLGRREFATRFLLPPTAVLLVLLVMLVLAT